jgi:transposase
MRCATVLDGASNQGIFESFVENVLVLRLYAGDVVVMGNLSSHKGVRLRILIESAGARVLYLLPYSPDLNPI